MNMIPVFSDLEGLSDRNYADEYLNSFYFTDILSCRTTLNAEVLMSSITPCRRELMVSCDWFMMSPPMLRRGANPVSQDIEKQLKGESNRKLNQCTNYRGAV